MIEKDPYLITAETIVAAPTTFKERIKHLGPSLILSAAIVGSGELIATTTLGARAGFTAFWVIILGCLIKVLVQVEFAKHTILTGNTPMKSLNELPGPKFGKAHWSVWFVLFIMLTKLIQVGGIIGGVAIILNMLFPQIDLMIFAFGMAILVAALVYRGYYHFIEKTSIWLIAFFTIFTFTSVYFLKYTPYALTWDQILSGLTFELPATQLMAVFGAFGITGVGGDEIIYYNYWCLEKGYAASTGPKEATLKWQNRAKGWIKVMELDAIVAMIIYTTVTAAFYLLGAAVLSNQPTLPEGYEMVESLSKMYTLSLGEGARYFFYFGAFVVLFSTLFAALAAWTRQISDTFGQIGWIDFSDLKVRKKSIAILAWVIPMLWATFFMFMKLPVLMVLIGGVTGSALLFLVVYAVIYFRYFDTPAAFKPRKVYDVFLWLSILSIAIIGVSGVWKVLF